MRFPAPNCLIIGLCVLSGFGLDVVNSQETPRGNLTIARIKYGGGGDWYNDPSAIPNLLEFIEREAGLSVADDEVKIALTDEKLFPIPYCISRDMVESDLLKLR